MLTLFLDFLIFFSLSVIVYILANALPDAQKEMPESEEMKIPVALVYIEKLDSSLKSFSEKSLRRIRILLLKMENAISNKITNVSESKKKSADLDIVTDDEGSKNNEDDKQV